MTRTAANGAVGLSPLCRLVARCLPSLFVWAISSPPATPLISHPSLLPKHFPTDPGRNQEVPSEDPLLNGIFGTLYTQGIQGNASPYVQVVVVLKHAIAYSLEDSDGFTRYDFNAVISNATLQDTYFPHFKMAIQEAGALGVMCSYNA